MEQPKEGFFISRISPKKDKLHYGIPAEGDQPLGHRC